MALIKSLLPCVTSSNILNLFEILIYEVLKYTSKKIAHNKFWKNKIHVIKTFFLNFYYPNTAF